MFIFSSFPTSAQFPALSVVKYFPFPGFSFRLIFLSLSEVSWLCSLWKSCIPCLSLDSDYFAFVLSSLFLGSDLSVSPKGLWAIHLPFQSEQDSYFVFCGITINRWFKFHSSDCPFYVLVFSSHAVYCFTC